MKIEDVRIERSAGEGRAAEVVVVDTDGTRVTIGLRLGPATGEDERAHVLDEARSALRAAADAIGAPTALPEGLPANSNDEISLEALQAAANDGRLLESLEEDDDNAYQESDEALPDERGEQALAAGLTRGRFGDPV